MAEQPPWLNIRWEDELSAQYFQKNTTDQDISQKGSLPHNKQHSQTAPAPWTPCSDIHTHTLSLFPGRTGAHASWPPLEPIPAQVAPIKAVLKQNRTILCSGSNSSSLSQNKSFSFLPALGYILPKKRSPHNPQAPSLMSFRNMEQDQTVPGGICIRSCQAGKFPHKVPSLGGVLASLHTHIPWQMQGSSFTPPLQPLPPGQVAAGRGE